MTELIGYLKELEQRVADLEDENLIMKDEMNRVTTDNLAMVKYVKSNLPSSMLFSPSFMVRAFSVWGHYFVAQLIIGAGFFILYLIFIFVVAGLFQSGS
jgi:hypothetical protein